MARKHKKRRTHVEEDTQEKTGGEKVPKSFVIRRGKVPALVRELIKDTRRMMSPYCALKLKERKSNNLKDYVALSGTLGVSHMLCFSTTELGTYLRLAKMPRGPTLYFKVEEYTLSKDIAASQRRPHSPGTEYLVSPLIVLNNMQSDERHVKLTDVMMQNLFPPIDIESIKLSQCRRVVLFRRDPETGDFDMRHYVVNVKAGGLSRGVRKIVRRKKLPNLSKYSDISEYVMGGGASDSEPEDTEESKVHIDAGQRAIEGHRGARKNKEEEEAAVKLTEVGPRMRLKLLKVEDGFCQGEVLYHAHIHREPEEIAALRQEMRRRREEKEKRKKEQAENVRKKRQADEDDEDHPLAHVKSDDSDDDAEYYRQQVGEEPDEGSFKKFKSSHRKEEEGKEKKTKKQENGVSFQDFMKKKKELKQKRDKQKAKKRQRKK